MQHKKRPIRILILGFAFCFFFKAAHAQETTPAQSQEDPANHVNDRGLLLGVYFPNDPNVSWNDLTAEKWVPDVSSEPRGQFLTFWIARTGETVSIQAVDGLLVPRATGFWHVGIQLVRGPKNSVTGTETWAVPVGTRPPPDKVDPEASGMDQAVRVITYVGPKYLGYVEHSIGGAGGWEYVGAGTVSLDELGKNLSLESELASAAIAEYHRHARAVDHMSATPSDVEGGCNCCRGNPEEWGLRHVNASWEAYAIFRYGESSACSQQSEEYVIKAPVPRSMASGASLNKSWDDLRMQAAAILKDTPDVFDHFFVSPKQDLVVALTDNGIAVLSANGSDMTSVLKVEKFQSPCFPVMEQWAMGKYVSGWETAIRKGPLTSPPAKPGR
jgi:hypothetical protein